MVGEFVRVQFHAPDRHVREPLFPDDVIGLGETGNPVLERERREFLKLPSDQLLRQIELGRYVPSLARRFVWSSLQWR